ncbi:SDR family NAD(P)-dependent oxidoreductase [Chryseobacterium viscerum]|uniref:SDR family NAD(P)-dependent oxidoreductase n=1 Tax=Chryseobacterium viscerum TaxID=1037377 RepID=A0A5N4BRC9_9FLAO|nr:SDR family NAD(P)-dependent oxidoreductase [Chryseobacterium viscerum]KAB1230951.1 SDR family NAD(P)-dependent oxidoreductase [Chryseobacterium viscerum]
MSHTKIWYITGASKGMGFSLVKKLLEKGHKVAATSRTITAFEGLDADPDNFLPLEVDLKDEQSIAQSIEKTIKQFGHLDVVVNNAGYGLGGAIEELSAEEIEENFQINFFAVLKVIRQALPYLRNQRSGHIINISSIAGFAPGLGWSMYAAAKFAVTGLSEALANDLKPLGINVTAVLPGWFRTSFAKPDSIAFGENQINDYQFLRTAHQKMNEIDGKQLGNPEKAADVFMKLTDVSNPPVLLFLGTDAAQRAENKIAELSEQIQQWKALSSSTDFKE